MRCLPSRYREQAHSYICFMLHALSVFATAPSVGASLLAIAV